MKIKFWGVRGSIPAPGPDTFRVGGNTTCVEVTTGNGHRIVVDAGTGFRILGTEVIKEQNPLPITLLLTHSHMDHLSGFIFFPPAYSTKFSLAVYGNKMAQDVIQRDIYDRRDNRYYPVSIDELQADIAFYPDFPSPFYVDDILIKMINLNHPGSGFAYSFEQNGKKAVFMTDNELGMEYRNGSSQEEFIEFCADAEILIHDAQYLPSEIEAHKGWGHSTYEEVADLAHQAGVPYILLFHHDPERSDVESDELLSSAREYCKKYNIECDLAVEGQQLTV